MEDIPTKLQVDPGWYLDGFSFLLELVTDILRLLTVLKPSNFVFRFVLLPVDLEYSYFAQEL